MQRPAQWCRYTGCRLYCRPAKEGCSWSSPNLQMWKASQCTNRLRASGPGKQRFAELTRNNFGLGIISAVTSNNDACSLLPHMIDEIDALRGAGLARLRALRREYSRRFRDSDSRSVLRLACELKNSGVVHRFFRDELVGHYKGAIGWLDPR